MPFRARSTTAAPTSTLGGVIEIPLPILVLPWLLAALAWIGFPWLARRVDRPHLLRWLPPGLVVVGGALLWLSASDAPAGGHDTRTMTFAATAVALCDARSALPDDRDAATRAFRDRAHEALHMLAADPALDRGLAGELLRSKEAVESGIAAGTAGSDLAGPIEALVESTARAMLDLGVEFEPCDG
jgi:hypothetical protein